MPSWHVALGLAMPGVVVAWLITGFPGDLLLEPRFILAIALMTVGRTVGHSDVAVRARRSVCPLTGPLPRNQDRPRRRHASCKAAFPRRHRSEPYAQIRDSYR